MSTLFPKLTRPVRWENTGGSFSLVCFPFPFLEGNDPGETWDFWVFKSHFNQSTRRFPLLWWIILVGFSRCLLRSKVRCSVRVVALEVSDTQRDFSRSCVFLWVLCPYGNGRTHSALLEAELQLKFLCSQALQCGRKDALRWREWIQLWDTKLWFLVCVLCHWADIWDGATKGLNVKQGSANAFTNHKPDLAPVVPLNNNLWGAERSQILTQTAQIPQGRFVGSQYHATVIGDIWAP